MPLRQLLPLQTVENILHILYEFVLDHHINSPLLIRENRVVLANLEPQSWVTMFVLSADKPS